MVIIKVTNKELSSDIKDEDKSDLGRLFRSLVSGGRAENHGYDPGEVKREAQALYDVNILANGCLKIEYDSCRVFNWSIVFLYDIILN